MCIVSLSFELLCISLLMTKKPLYGFEIEIISLLNVILTGENKLISKTKSNTFFFFFYERESGNH